MTGDRFDVACVGRPVTHTWTDIVSRFRTALANTDRDPAAALGRALSQFAGSPQELVDMLRHPERDARTRALAYAIEQFAGVDDPRNPLRQLNAERIHGDLATLVEQRLSAIARQSREIGEQIRQTGLEFAMPSLLERDPQRGVDVARAGIAGHAAELERIRRMPKYRGISPAPSGPPEVPTEYVPCGHGSRFGDAGSEHKVVAHRGPSPAVG